MEVSDTDYLHRLNDTVPNKRVGLSMKLNSKQASTSLFQYFLRLPDFLVANAHFRAEGTPPTPLLP
jgi:hypothetical protein